MNRFWPLPAMRQARASYEREKSATPSGSNPQRADRILPHSLTARWGLWSGLKRQPAGVMKHRPAAGAFFTA